MTPVFEFAQEGMEYWQAIHSREPLTKLYVRENKIKPICSCQNLEKIYMAVAEDQALFPDPLFLIEGFSKREHTRGRSSPHIARYDNWYGFRPLPNRTLW